MNKSSQLTIEVLENLIVTDKPCLTDIDKEVLRSAIRQIVYLETTLEKTQHVLNRTIREAFL